MARAMNVSGTLRDPALLACEVSRYVQIDLQDPSQAKELCPQDGGPKMHRRHGTTHEFQDRKPKEVSL